MKRLKIIICAICVICGAFSCSDMLENDNSRMVFDPALDQKTDSVFYALGILQGMQQLADQYLFQGEMRGDLTSTTSYTDNNLRQLANFSATTANRYDSAYVFYKVINNCNYYIAHRDTTLRTGASLVVMQEYVAVKAIRAWAYMQLARVYKKVPFVTKPLTKISQIDNNDYPELEMADIVARLAPDLEQYSGYLPPSYSNNTPSSSAFAVGRVLMPVDLVLGDMYLETEQFDKAAQHYVNYLSLDQVRVNHTAYWEDVDRDRSRGESVDLPGDWDRTNNTVNRVPSASDWSEIFTKTGSNISDDIICYIPFAPSSQQGLTTAIPKAFGYDYYSTSLSGEDRYISETQILPSASYVALSNAQDYYYYSTVGTSSVPVFNTVKLGDQRYPSITHEKIDTEADSTALWITKNNVPRVILYRTTTVLMHLAEALNRLGYYDAAFAILKEGISPLLVSNSGTAEMQGVDYYVRPATFDALRNNYPLLSTANISKFATLANWYGVHGHGTGYTCDQYAGVPQLGVSPYQLDAIVSRKMQDIAQQYGVTVGTTPQDSVNAVEDLLCDEYALEFAFEGSRFFDLCRLARHKNASGLYSGNFGGQWLARKLAYKNPAVSLEDENNWYLPFK